VIVKGITGEAVWEYLTNAATWPSYYSNSSDIKMLNQEDTHLISNTRFFFKTFGFPVDAEVVFIINSFYSINFISFQLMMSV
ncbi:hypothetical protein Q604_UNBC18641G0001, partial [human gut metagenome]